MTKVNGMVFTRPFTARHGHLLGRFLFEDSVCYISDFKNSEQYDLMAVFYRYYNGRDKTRLEAVADVVPAAEVITRCRLLRKLDRRKAERMVWAMSLAIQETLDRFQPDLVVGIPMDNYVLDLLERYQRARGMRGMFPHESSIPKYTRYTGRGEHITLREPSSSEVDQVIATLTQPNFKPVWLKPHRTSMDVIRIRLRELGKAAYFAYQRWANDDPLNFHYNTVYPLIVDGHAHPLRSELLPSKYFDESWQEKLKGTDREVVLYPLQFSPEASLDYYVHDVQLVNYLAATERALATLSERYTVLVKEHPDIYGFRAAEVYQMIKRFTNVILVPVHTPIQTLIEVADAVVVYAGATVGIEARLRDKRVVCLSRPYYYMDGEINVVGKFDNIERLPELIDSAPTQCDKQRFVHRILANTLPGRFNFVHLNDRDPVQVRHVEDMAGEMRNLFLGRNEPLVGELR